MSDESKKAGETDKELSRRGLFEAAAMVVGAVGASLVAGQPALANTSDIAVDSLGRVTVKGAVLGGEGGALKGSEMRTQVAKAEIFDNHCGNNRNHCAKAAATAKKPRMQKR